MTVQTKGRAGRAESVCGREKPASLGKGEPARDPRGPRRSRRLPVGGARLTAALILPWIAALCAGDLVLLLCDLLRLAGTGNPAGYSLTGRFLAALVTSGRLSAVLAAPALLTLVGGAAVLASFRLLRTAALRAAHAVRRDLFADLLRRPLPKPGDQPDRTTMGRFAGGTDAASDLIGRVLPRLASGTALAVGLLAPMFALRPARPYLALVSVVFLLLGLLGGYALQRVRIRRIREGRRAAEDVGRHAAETAMGGTDIRLRRPEEACAREFAAINTDLRRRQCGESLLDSATRLAAFSLSCLCLTLTAVLGGSLCRSGGYAAWEVAVCCLCAFLLPLLSFRLAARAASAVELAQEAYVPPAARTPTAEAAEAPDALRLSGPSRGDVVFDHVSFGYEPDQPLLRRVSFSACVGQRIVLVDPEGKAKSAVAALLTGLCETDHRLYGGLITLNGADIRAYSRDVLHAIVAASFRDPRLFTGTVMENIRFGCPEATDEKVRETARTVGAHSLIMRMSAGYETPVVNGGANLSRAERQLISICRAAVSRALVLVFDEPVADLDAFAARRILRGLERLTRRAAVIVLTRSSIPARGADSILFIEDGTVAERGAHGQLMALHGRYRALYESATTY